MNSVQRSRRRIGSDVWRVWANRFAVFSAVASAFFATLVACRAEPPTEEQIAFFESKIRPILVDRCYECHSRDAKESGGQLHLDAPNSMRSGGSQGPAIVPGQADKSLLVRAISYSDSHLQMPPDSKLPDQEIEAIKQWIAMGAPDPRPEQMQAPKALLSVSELKELAKNHWAYQPLEAKPVETALVAGTESWDPIDISIANRLHERGLTMSPTADRRTLLRRLYYDLLGLPPTHDQLERYMQMPESDWYQIAVDELLQSPHFGERMARRWMDVMRYADTKGYVFVEDRQYPHAYRYRDWLIRSFNKDLPYDQFVKYQLVGERLAPNNEDGNLDAMGMLTLGRRFLQNKNDIADDRIDVVSRGLLAITASCARCHDHKFDPVSAEDYYSLHGAFIGSDEPGGDPSPMRLVDKPEQSESYVFLRGNPGNRGPTVVRRFFPFLSKQQPKLLATGSGRLDLAEAIVDPSNPLTARVYVNRIWTWIVGTPIVDTPSDFGLRCEPPAYQSVLDRLAWDFMQKGWSTKELIRRIVQSHAYKQSSAIRPELQSIDPDNRFLWRGNRKRMDFESYRDALLCATGLLDQTVGGESVKIHESPFPKRRTVYAYIDRQNLPQLFRVFDLASPDAHAPSRAQTTVPQQGLVLLNSDFMLEMLERVASEAEQLSRTSATGAGASVQNELGVNYLFEKILLRSPTERERKQFLEFLNQADIEIPAIRENAWEYGYAKFSPESGRVEAFHQLPRYHENRWSGNGELPDSELHWTMLTADGGHAGFTTQQSTVRRWRANKAGNVRVAGLFKHPSENGDGVRGTIVLRSSERLGQWTMKHGETDTTLDSIHVEPGDTIDFVVDSNGDDSYDSFHWVVSVVYHDGGEQFDSKKQFGGYQPKAGTIWQQAAHVLLLTNEFCFVD